MIARLIVSLLLFLACAHPSGAADKQPYDLVIKNARVMDPESGRDESGLNIGVTGGTVAVITNEPIEGKSVIDAKGMVAAPGFIDLLSYDPNHYGVWYKISDGVTTNLAMHGGAVKPANWLATYEKAGSPVNFGAGFFYNLARTRLGIGPYRPANASEIKKLVEWAERGIKEGALGIGMSLEYHPGTSKDEVEAMALVAARFNVPVFFHARYSDMEPPGTNIAALDEIISVARKTGAAVHVDHINSTGGTFSMDRSIAMIEKARSEEGLDITACVYPYPFWATYLSSARFDPGWQKRFRITYEDLQISGTKERLDRESFDKNRRLGKIAVAYAIPEDDVTRALKASFVMIGSDAILEPGDNNHPRAAGAFARTLAVYAREKGTIDLMEAIGKMTILPARRLEASSPAFRKKGRLKAGADADVVIFDPLRVKDTATVERPASHSIGIDYVIVNGVVVRTPEGLIKSKLPGRAIRSTVK
jgi:dihydroorotase